MILGFNKNTWPLGKVKATPTTDSRENSQLKKKKKKKTSTTGNVSCQQHTIMVSTFSCQHLEWLNFF